MLICVSTLPRTPGPHWQSLGFPLGLESAGSGPFLCPKRAKPPIRPHALALETNLNRARCLRTVPSWHRGLPAGARVFSSAGPGRRRIIDHVARFAPGWPFRRCH